MQNCGTEKQKQTNKSDMGGKIKSKVLAQNDTTTNCEKSKRNNADTKNKDGKEKTKQNKLFIHD